MNLIKEVLADAPDDLSSAELVVLLVLAENASDKTRQGWPGLDKLTRRCRLSPTGLRTVFQRLAARGLEVRVAVGTDKAGRPVYAHDGHQTVYRVPQFGPRGDATTSPPADAATSPLDARGDATTSQRRRAHVAEATQPRRPSPHIPSSSRQAPRAADEPGDETLDGLPPALATIRRSLATTDPDSTLDEARAVAQLVAEKHRPKSVAYYQKIADGVGYGAYLAEVRSAAAEERRRALEERRRTAPPCPHGQRGGDTLRTVSGEPLCALCRHGLPQPEPAAETDPRIAEIVTIWRSEQLADGHTPTTAELIEITQRAQDLYPARDAGRRTA